ncbi:MAG: DUF1428 family protein [bacterium]
MTHYIDGFVLPVPRDQLKTYREVVEKVAEIWKEHGALDYSEYVGDNFSLEAPDLSLMSQTQKRMKPSSLDGSYLNLVRRTILQMRESQPTQGWRI